MQNSEVRSYGILCFKRNILFYLQKLKMDTTLKCNFLQQFFLSKSEIKPSLQTLPFTVPETSHYRLITDAQTPRLCAGHLQIYYFPLSAANEFVFAYKQLLSPPTFLHVYYFNRPANGRLEGDLQRKTLTNSIIAGSVEQSKASGFAFRSSQTPEIQQWIYYTCRLHNPFLTSQNSTQLFKRLNYCGIVFLPQRTTQASILKLVFALQPKTASSCAPGVLTSRCSTTEALPGSSLLPEHRHSATGEQGGQERKSS